MSQDKQVSSLKGQVMWIDQLENYGGSVKVRMYFKIGYQPTLLTCTMSIRKYNELTSYFVHNPTNAIYTFLIADLMDYHILDITEEDILELWKLNLAEEAERRCTA